MKRKAFGLLVAAFSCLSAQGALACPYCNIFNRLHESVQESTDIFRGEVLRPLDKYKAEVKVLNVLRGTHQVGTTVTTEVFRLNFRVGDKFVFLERNARSPAFGTLDLEMEDEILFLAQGKPDICSLEEAIQRVQGVSVETHKKGMEYIAAHHAAAVRPLIAELNSLMSQVFSNEKSSFGEHRLANLAEALLIEPTDGGRAFVLSQIDSFPSQKSSPFGWGALPLICLGAIGVSLVLAGFLRLGTGVFLRRPPTHRPWPREVFTAVPILVVACVAWYWYQSFASQTIWLVFFSVIIGVWLLLVALLWLGTRVFLRQPFPSSPRSLLIFVTSTSVLLTGGAWCSYPVPNFPSSRGVFLRDLLSPTTKHKELLTAVKERTFETCSRRKGPALAEAVYAMVLAGVATPNELQAKLTSGEDADMLALGLYWAGNDRSRWWDMDLAHSFWEKSLSVARTRRLKTAILHEMEAHPKRHL